MDFFKTLFKSKKSIEKIGEDLDIDNNQYIVTFKNNLDIILTDLLKPIANKDDKHNYQTLTLLQDPKNCNNLTLFLTKNIRQNFDSIELTELADKIFFSKNKRSNCSTEKCEKLDEETYIIDEKQYTKRNLCKIISKHYIKHLN